MNLRIKIKYYILKEYLNLFINLSFIPMKKTDENILVNQMLTVIITARNLELYL